MQSENRMFDDMVKMVNGLAGTFAGMGREAETSAREKFKEWMGGADFVGRDEFEAVKAMAAAARDENEILKARIAARLFLKMRREAGLLMIPYLAWLVFAATLNSTIASLNPGAGTSLLG